MDSWADHCLSQQGYSLPERPPCACDKDNHLEMTCTSKPATPATWTELSGIQGGSLTKHFYFGFYFWIMDKHAQFLCQEMTIFSSVADKLWGGFTATLVFLQET